MKKIAHRKTCRCQRQPLHRLSRLQPRRRRAGAPPANFLDIVITLEDYTSIVRLLKAGIPATPDADAETKFDTDDTKGYNVIAEIPGAPPHPPRRLLTPAGRRPTHNLSPAKSPGNRFVGAFLLLSPWLKTELTLH